MRILILRAVQRVDDFFKGRVVEFCDFRNSLEMWWSDLID